LNDTLILKGQDKRDFLSYGRYCIDSKARVSHKESFLTKTFASHNKDLITLILYAFDVDMRVKGSCA
jgi:hypothetical protein